jgi:hypothetical protein
VQTDSHDITLHGVYVKDVKGGANDDLSSFRQHGVKNPNECPFASGINIGERAEKVDVTNVHINDVYALGNS